MPKKLRRATTPRANGIKRTTVDEYNEMIEKHGLFSDGVRTF